MNSLVLVAIFVVLSVLLQVAVLHLSARLCQLPKRSWARAGAAVFVRLVILVAVFAIIARLADAFDSWHGALLFLVVDLIVTVLLVRSMFGSRLPAALGTWATNLVLGVIVATGMVFGFREFCGLYEVTSSAMSPNLRGYHTIKLFKTAIILSAQPTIPGMNTVSPRVDHPRQLSPRPTNIEKRRDRPSIHIARIASSAIKRSFPIAGIRWCSGFPLSPRLCTSSGSSVCLGRGSKFVMGQFGSTANA